jgi:diguanylate cyclase (GGDEF)-like protein
MVEEKEGPRLIVGLNDIDAQVRQEEMYSRRLAQAQAEASIDALTGVRNKHAYMAEEAQIDRRIAEHRQPPFAVVMLDVNDLKKINDTAGHQAGDRYLRDACKVICEIFKHSPVFRIGGDEFAVIAQGSDFVCIEDRMEKVRAHNAGALQGGGILIACGMACFEDDARVADVLERADQNMYENKNALKAAYHTSTE